MAACALIADLGDRQLAEGPREGGAADAPAVDLDARPSDDQAAPACTREPVTLSPPELLLLLDLSGSMTTAVDGGSRQEVQTKGVVDFIRDERSRSVVAGLAFHPASETAQCNPDVHRTLAVPFGPLDTLDGGTAREIIQKVSTTPAVGTSPWRAGVVGAATPLTQAVAAKKKPTLVFVADLMPTRDCGDEGGALVNAIRAFQSLTPPVRTYVIGLTQSLEQDVLFDRLAVAGGTERRTAFTSSRPSARWLTGVLETIREEVRCDVDLPGGAAFDATKTPLVIAGATETPLPLVANAEACKSGDGYYALHNAPEGDAGTGPLSGRARLCPETCTKAQAGTEIVSGSCP